MIAVDVETYDPEIKARGPGWHRDGFVAGISVGTESGFRGYYPVRHEGGGNMDPNRVFSWLREQMALPVPKVGAKLLYDVGFLGAAGVPVYGPLYDVQVAEPLLDGDRFQYSLDSIATDRIGRSKKHTAMDDLLVARYGKKNPRGNIWRLPGDQPELINYVHDDVDLPLKVFAVQRPLLEKEGLWPLFLMESRLIPMLVAMRNRGVRVDLAKTEELYDLFTREQEELQVRLGDVSVWAARQLAPLFDGEGVEYDRTPTGLPSITAGWLEQQDSETAKLVVEIRRLDKLRSTFLRGGILESHHKGRIHCSFNQLKGEGGGAITGRFSSSSPNLQFIPVRTERGKLLRTLFVPDGGEEWEKQDESQIEFRMMVHDGAMMGLESAQDIAALYQRDPATDFHEVVEEIVFGTKGVKANRRPTKNINFGVAFGEGAEKLARTLGFDTVEEGLALIRRYHAKIPFMRRLSLNLMGQAKSIGEIRTLLGRKRRYDKYEITEWDEKTKKKVQVVLPHWVPGSVRAFTYKAIADRTQGSAADILKSAMDKIWRSGLCDAAGVPLLTVHDELDWSRPRTKEALEATAEAKRIMETCVSLKVPLKVEASYGQNWGDCE
jgi:DNA polymerase I-like protein with 3'-5' exonuclease and polymerase domains